jgi:hypothetical protein
MNNQNKDNIIDISDYKKGMDIPKGKKYKFKVGRNSFISDSECMKSKDILTMAGKIPYTNHRLFQNFHGGESKSLDYEDIICFTEPGIEKFRTIPTDPTDGDHT